MGDRAEWDLPSELAHEKSVYEPTVFIWWVAREVQPPGVDLGVGVTAILKLDEEAREWWGDRSHHVKEIRRSGKGCAVVINLFGGNDHGVFKPTNKVGGD